jgi:hypothetical protein
VTDYDLGGGDARPARRTIRRRLTDTPLARQHDLVVKGRERRGVTIAWSRFDRSKYPAPALALAAHAQRSLAAGEYNAITLFARIASAMALHGAPIDLVTAAARVPGDEARHADLAMRMAALLDGGDEHATIVIDHAAMENQWRGPLSLDALDATMAEIAAIGETLAAALLTGCQRRAVDPVAHGVFSALVADEIHHARLGWYYLAWRSPQWTRAERQAVADRAAALVVDVARRFARGRDAPRGSQRAARALGVLDSPAQRAVVRQVMEDEIVPALDALGLGATHAWRLRRRAR